MRLFGSDRLPPGVRRVFRLPWNRREMRRDLNDELRFHVQMRAEALRARGMPAVEAEAEALRRLGVEGELEAYCLRIDERRALIDRATGWLEDLREDLRLALRHARRSPGFTAIAVLTLALGIGANTAIFSVVHRLLLAPLPYPDGNSLVLLTMDGKEGGRAPATGKMLGAWRDRSRSLASIAAMSIDAIAVQDFAEQDTIVAYITPNYLDVLGVHPLVGRTFTASDANPGAPPVAMITSGLWRRRYGARAEIIGTPLHVDDKTFTIVGVAPPTMGDPFSLGWAGQQLHDATPSIFLPERLTALDYTDAIARLRPGVSAERASTELQAITAATALSTAGRGSPPPTCCARAHHAQDFFDQREVMAVKVLFLAVGALLLIACANVANLLMARAWTRRREFAVRVALGGGRGRLVRLVLTESLMTAIAGGVLGLAVAWASLRAILVLRPPSLAGLDGVQLDNAVLFWSLGLSVAAGILFGCAPAMFAGGQHVGDLLRGETRAATGDRGVQRVRAGLIVAEIAMALVLLTGAGLLVRSFVALQRTPLGFDPSGLLAVETIMGPGMPRSRTREQRLGIAHEILDRLRATPGVVEGGIGSMPGQPWHMFGTVLESDPDSAGEVHRVANFGVTLITDNYFHLTGMQLMSGRAPNWPMALAPGSPGAPPVSAVPPVEVVVDQRLAHDLWPRGNAVGAIIHAVHPRSAGEEFVVTGVVRTARIPSVSGHDEAEMYQPTVVPANASYLLRVDVPPATILPALRATVAATAPGVIARSTTVAEDYLRDARAPTTFAMALLGAFAVVALALSAVGLYGTISYSVSQRTREIGVRIALGADAPAIRRLVLTDGVRLAAAGALIGILGSVAATRILQGMLYQTAASDPITLGAMAALVMCIALISSYVPARRALRVDPTEALRDE